MGGAAGGGLSTAAMAHGGPSALATHRATTNQSSSSGPPPGTSAAVPPPNLAALGADLLDKNQNLNWKQIRNVAHMPIVAVDLYGGGGGGDEDGNAQVAMFPPKPEDDSANIPMADGIIKSKSVGSVPTTLYVRRDESSSASHRALRRLLTRSKGYEAVFRDTLSAGEKEAGVDNTAIVVPSPQLLLGSRNTKDLHPATACQYSLPTDTSEEPHAIQEEDADANNNSNVVSLRNGNLDGSTTSQNNDYDRVTLNFKVQSNKKALSVLPEEAVSILIAKAKKTS